MRERAERAHRASPPRDKRPMLSPMEADAALMLAKHLEPRGEDGKPITNEADVYKWYYDRNNSPTARARRAKWYGTPE